MEPNQNQTHSRIYELAKERLSLKKVIESIEKQVEDLDAQVILELIMLNETSTRVVIDDVQYTLYTTSSSGKEYLNRMKLVEAGVTNEQLNKGISIGKAYTSVTMKKIGGSKDEE